MPIDDTQFHPAIKLLLLLGGLFFVGWCAGSQVIPFSFSDDLFIFELLGMGAVFLFIVPVVLLFLYILITLFINYYFPNIGYYQRLGLIVLGIVVFFWGVLLA